MIPTSRVGRTASGAYVVLVAGLATVGAATGSTGPILVAGLLTLPTSVPAVIGFYLVVGLLALVPGANPNSSSGSACSPPEICQEMSTGGPATWFTLTTGAVGILALGVAALLNVVLARMLWRSVRGSASASGPSRTGA